AAVETSAHSWHCSGPVPVRARSAPTCPQARTDEAHAAPATGADLAARAVAPRASSVRAVDRLELLQAAPGADGDARERALREVHRHLRLVAQPFVEPVQERAAAGEHD